MNQSRRRVSIVIPAYNEEHHLRACLDAIAAQTVKPLEVIVVDNNSGDRTAAIAAEYPFVRLVTVPQQGRVFARNAGFDAARGDILGRIDADIVLPSHWVSHLEAFYTKAGNADVAWSGGGSFYNVRLPRLVSFAYSLLAFRLNKLLLGHYTLWGSNMALTRVQWQAVRAGVCTRNDIHEDLDLAIHLAGHTYRIAYDASLKVRAELRRVNTERHALREYLEWWPRTLRIHGVKAWPICWFFGVAILYGATYVLWAAEKVSGLFGRAPLVRSHTDKDSPSRP